MDELEPITDRDPGDEQGANRYGRRIGGFGMFLPGVRFETPDGGLGGGGEQAAPGGEGGAGTAVVEPPVEAGGGEEAAAAEAAGLSIDEFRAAMREESAGAFRDMLAEAEREEIARRDAEQRASQTPELPAWDAFDPDVARQHVESWLAPVLQKLDQVLSPVLETHQAQTLEQGERQAKTILDGHAQEIGEFDRDRAIRESAFLMRQAEQSGRQMDPEDALKQAAKQQFDFEEKIRADERAKLQGTAQNLADAGRDGAITAAAAEAPAPLKPGERRDYKQEMRASLARMGQGAGVGTPTG